MYGIFFSLPLPAFSKAVNNEKLTDYINIITTSLISAEQTQQGMWSYRVAKDLIIDGDKKSSIEQYSPLNESENHWVLQTLNNQKPTSTDISQYLEEKEEEVANALSANIEHPFLGLIDVNSIKIEAEQGDLVSLSFNGLYPKFGDAANGKIDGTLMLDINKKYVTQLELKNNDELTVKVVLAIKKWHLKIAFDKVKNATVQRRRSSQLQGTAMIFASILVTADLSFTQYHFVGVEL